jgi:hypothetical protein
MSADIQVHGKALADLMAAGGGRVPLSRAAILLPRRRTRRHVKTAVLRILRDGDDSPRDLLTGCKFIQYPGLAGIRAQKKASGLFNFTATWDA